MDYYTVVVSFEHIACLCVMLLGDIALEFLLLCRTYNTIFLFLPFLAFCHTLSSKRNSSSKKKT